MNKISQADIARAWGVSPARIAQYKKEKPEGMPIDSLEAAFNWLSVKYPDRAAAIEQAQEKASGTAEDLEAPPPMPSTGELKGKGVAVVVARLVVSENTAWGYLQDAIKEKQRGNVLSYLKHYRQCADARMKAEEALVEYQVKTRELAPVSETVELMGKILGPIMTQLSAHAHACSARANPNDPQLAFDAIEAGTEKMKEQIRSALEGLKNEA